ncbi:MAG: 1,6-anhydro-N-acetylmuramyl-L-alanine amidase AmpD, partial [Zoogloeaceae bacterium]|nr:1,6-anhydro-N-acetylmuramyl-L-alanine amidase AmpD [Zoogloeaceae bacterium]
AHFFIRRDGETVQFVRLHDRAWHAGVSAWQGRENCNDYSVGIELEGSDRQPFDTRQYAALKPLLAALRAACPITDIVGHEHIAPGRKTDPGPCFDWAALDQGSEKSAAALPPEVGGQA